MNHTKAIEDADNAHADRYAEQLGRELAKATAEIAELRAQLSAAPLMGAAVDAGWVSVDERLPEPDWPVLAHNGKWTGVAVWMSGDYLEPLERWQDEHREFIDMMGPAITHWMPLPPAPSSDKGVAHG